MLFERRFAIRALGLGAVSAAIGAIPAASQQMRCTLHDAPKPEGYTEASVSDAFEETGFRLLRHKESGEIVAYSPIGSGNGRARFVFLPIGLDELYRGLAQRTFL